MRKHPREIDYSQQTDSLLTQEPFLIQKIASTLQVDAVKAKEALTEVLKFLALVGHSQQRLTPSLKVDLTWHEFILFTRTYHLFCEKEYGRYIHHHPGGDEQENKTNFSKTLKHYILYIGQPPSHFWGKEADELYENAQCGTNF